MLTRETIEGLGVDLEEWRIEAVAHGLNGTFERRAHWWRKNRDVPPEELVEWITTLFLPGIRALSSPPGDAGRSGRSGPPRPGRGGSVSRDDTDPPRRVRPGPPRRIATRPTVASIASCDRTGSACRTGASPKSTTRSSANASTPVSRCGPGGQRAARIIARGPKRAPGRSGTRSSVGAPTIAASAPSRSAGSSVQGIPAKDRSPAQSGFSP